MATTGAALLLIASVIVVASRWESIPAEARFSGLVAALIAAYFAAEAGRTRFPTTSQALAVLAAAITAPVGVAASATLEQPWPVCTVVGGLSALICTETQSRRWRAPSLKVATVVAFVMAIVGASALTGAPAPLFGAIGAAVALAVGATRRGIALAAAVGLSPALILLAEAGIGPGTMRRIGVTGDVLAWSGPVSGAIAAVVIALAAQRRQNLPLAIGSLAVLASGVATGLVAGDVSEIVWWCVPGAALIVLEALGATRPTSVWHRCGAAAPPFVAPLVAVGVVAPLVFVAQRSAAETPPTLWILPLVLSGIALLSSAAGSAGRADNEWFVVASLLGASGLFLSAVIVAGAPLVLVALVALVLWAGVTAATGWRTWELTTATTTLWGLVAATAGAAEPLWAQVALVAGFGIALVLAVSFVPRCDHGVRLVAAALVTGGALHLVVDTGRPVEGLTAAVALIAFGVLLRPQIALAPLSVAEAAVVLSFLDNEIGWWNVAIIAVLAVASAAAAERSVRSPWAHVSAGLVIAAWALGLLVAGIDLTLVTVLLGVTAIAATGIASVGREYLSLSTAALVAGGLTLATSLGTEPVLVSLALIMVSAQAIVFGATADNRPVILAGAVGFCGAAVSLWWTTGANALVIETIAPYGATGDDVVIGVAGVALLGVGLILRHASSQSTWLAYGPGLGLLGTWLLSTQLEPGTEWATFGALALGVAAVGLGGLRRLGAPLVMGTAIVAGSLLISAGPRLAATPTWAWIALGGLGLLVLAALVERDERPLLPTSDGHTRSHLESFLEEYE